MDLQKKMDELGSAFEQFKKANDERLAEIAKKGSVDPLLTDKVNKANEDITRLTAERDRMTEELKAVQTALNRSGKGGKEGPSDSEIEAKAAFNILMRKGMQALSPAQVKALSTDSDADGGYLVRPELSARIISKVFESSPMRQLAAIETISSDALDIMQDLDQASSGWVAERGSRPQTNTPQVRKLQIPVHELYAEPAATQKQLDDAAWDMEGWLAKKCSDKFGRDEATAFVSGTGVGQPRGFLTYPAGANGQSQIEQIVTGNATLLTADGLVNLFYALKEPYQKNATWIMQRLSVATVRLFKDTQNRYLWEPSLTQGSPDMLIGRPVMQAADMQAIGAGSLSVAVGDFKQAYQIVDRIGIRTLRDPYSSKGSVLFYTTKRVGGDVVNFEAVKLQKTST